MEVTCFRAAIRALPSFSFDMFAVSIIPVLASVPSRATSSRVLPHRIAAGPRPHAPKEHRFRGARGEQSEEHRFRKWARSQGAEDVDLYQQLYRGVRNRTFVEMGALDGTTFSNSLAFERGLGWIGILIEANPSQCSQLQRNRPGMSIMCPMAVSNDSSVQSFETGAHPAVFSSHSEARFGPLGSEVRERAHPKATRKTVAVPSAPLGELLRKGLHQLGRREIELFVLDVEGAEEQVLASMDWAIPVNTWCIENGHTPHIAATMVANGYHKLPLTLHNKMNTVWAQKA